MEELIQDLRYTGRSLLKQPGFVSVVILISALGIGATATVLCLIHGVLLTPPPYHEPEQIIVLAPARLDGRTAENSCTSSQWHQWKNEARSFADLAAYAWTFDYVIDSRGSQFIEGMEVTNSYFRTVGLMPILGRPFLESEAQPRHEPVIILGYDFWQRRFHGASNIIGQSIRVSRQQVPLTIIGVMPPGVRFLPAPSAANDPHYDVDARVDYWVPTAPDPASPKDGGWNAVARLRAGISLTQARAELKALAARQARADRDFEGVTVTAQPLTAQLNETGQRQLMPLLGAVALVFLIACGNVIALFLSRGTRREPEFALRRALGASGLQLSRQVMLESILLAPLAALPGAGLAAGVVTLLKHFCGAAVPRLDSVTVGWPLAIYCLGAAMIIGVVAGLAPAVRAMRVDPARGLQNAGRQRGLGRGGRQLLTGVAIAQIALTLALLAGAGLLIRTLRQMDRSPGGFDTRNLLTLSVTVFEWERWKQFHEVTLHRVGALPGVKSAAWVWGLPLTGNKWMSRFRIEGQPPPTGPADQIILPTRTVSPDYFDTLGYRFVAGRNFLRSDNQSNWQFPKPGPRDTPFVAIVNQALADQYFPHANPLGKKLRFTFWQDRPMEIIGVVTSKRSEGLTNPLTPEVYCCLWQQPVFTKHLVVRTRSDPRALAGPVQREMRDLDPEAAIDHVQTLEQIRARSVAPQAFVARLMTAFAVVATALALAGIHGVLALGVKSRQRELAIRLAVGARKSDVLRLILSEGAILVICGLALGAWCALALARLLRGFLFGVEPTDPAYLCGVMLVFAVAGLAACWLPARRATQVDPMLALRGE